jgi:hypothetical protein
MHSYTMNPKITIVITIAIAIVGAATISSDITPADAKRKSVEPKFNTDEIGVPGSSMGFKQKSECKQFVDNAGGRYSECYKFK